MPSRRALMPPHLLVLLCILASSADAGKTPAGGDKGETFPRNAQPSGAEEEQHARHARVMGQQNAEGYRLIPVQGRSSEQRGRKDSANDTDRAPRVVFGNISSGDVDSLELAGSPRVLQSGGSQILRKTAEDDRRKAPRSIYPSISSPRGIPALENNTPRPLRQGSEHPNWRSPQLGQSPPAGSLLPERGQADPYQSGVGGNGEIPGRSEEKKAVTPSGFNLAWRKGSVRNGQRLRNQSFSCENLTSSSSKFKLGSFNQQPLNSAEENIQFPEDVTFPDAAEADNFPEENLSENETLASIMREKFQEDGSIYDQSVAEVNMLLGRSSLDLAHENEVRQNLSFVSEYIYEGSQTGDSIEGNSLSENGKTTENSRKSHEKLLVNPELRRQSLKSLEQRIQHNITPSPHLDTMADTNWSSDKMNQQNPLAYKTEVQAASPLRIEESVTTDTSKLSQRHDDKIHPQSRAEMASDKLASEMRLFGKNLDDITEASEGFPEVLKLPTRMKREVINFEAREEEEEQTNKQQREQTGEDKHYTYEDSVNRRPRQVVHSTRGIEVPLVRHGRERLSIIRKKVTRNQTRSYHTFPPKKYYNIFIKNFPQIFKNYHTKLPNQHAHLPAKRIRQQVNNKVDSRGTDHAKKEAGKMSKAHTPHVARLVGRGEKAYGKSPQQRHARSRNRAKRKATTREVWALAGEDTLLPCDLGVRTPRDAIQMVMWLKEGSHTPLFSVDFREQERGSPQIWRDNSSSTARRALLYPAEEARQYRPTDTLLARRVNEFGETVEEEEEEDTEGAVEDVGGLIVREVEVGDATVYRCRVDFLLTATRNARVNLTVVVPPTSVGVAWWLDEERGDNSGGEVGPFREGDSPTLICYTRDAWPPPRVVWLEEDVLVDNSFTIDSKNEAVVNSMTILNVTRAHHLRRYMCNATNSNLTRPVSRTVLLQMSLDVLGVKMDSVGPLSAGMRAEVQCTVWGSSPPPTVIWTLGETTLPSPNTWNSDDRNRSVSMVSFTPAPTDDGARLECSAFNPVMASDSSPQQSHADAQILDVNYMPRVSVSLGNALDAGNIKEGDDLYFECSVVAKPPPHRVTWSHNGKRLQAGPGVLVSNQTLVLQKVSRSNAGNYTCHATNAEGMSSSNPLTLDVKYSPVCASSVASQHSVAKHENAIISCNVLANPPVVQFSWAFNNTAEAVSVPKDRYVVNGTESVVNYTPVTELDYGTLLCWASNEIGVQEHPCLFQIMAAGKPDPPHNCRAFDVTISSLQVSCLPGDDGGLGQTFILQVLEASGDQEPVVEVTRETASFSVANLRPATAYRLLVTATNAKGESHPAELRAYTVALNHPQHETPAEPTRGRETGSEVAVGVLVGAVLTCLPVAIVVVAMGVRTCLKLRAARWRRRHGDESEKDAGESEGVSTGRPLLTGKGTPGSGGGLSTESGSDITTITGGVGISSSATLPATPSPGHSETQVSQVHPTEAGGMLYTGARIYVPDHTHEAGPQICSTSNAKLRRGPYSTPEDKYDGDNEMLEITLPPPAAYDQGYQSPSHKYQLGPVQGYQAGAVQGYQPRVHQGYPPQDQAHARLKQGYQQSYEDYQSLHRNGQLTASGYPIVPVAGQPSVHYISSAATIAQDFHSSPKMEPFSGISKVSGSSSFAGLPVTGKDPKADSARVLTHETDSKMSALYNPLAMFTPSASGSPPASFQQTKCSPVRSERTPFSTGSLKRPMKPQGQDIVRLKDNSLQRNRSASLSSVRGKRESSV